jgi:biopolymer transport protein ExbB/TolQ
MTSPQPSVATERAIRKEHRSRATWAAFLVGLPLAAGVLSLIDHGFVGGEETRRYLHHPLERVEVIMFCCALGAFTAKLLRNLTERWACRAEVLPAWDGQPVSVSTATDLLSGLGRLPRRLQTSLIGRRTIAVLDFLRSRGSVEDLDDHLRDLADTDALALEGSYSLTRFITWAIPILGFLGTVLGITGAISGVTPEVLEKSLSTVTDGLALAFDATALALALTMVTMFLSFLVERAEQSVLDRVDRFVHRELAHRFERTGAEGGEFIDVVRRNTDVLLQGVEKLVQRQTTLWAQALADADRRHQEADKRSQEVIAEALKGAMEQTLEAHARRLAALEKQTTEHIGSLAEKLKTLAVAVRDAGREQQAALTQVAQGVAAQVETLSQLHEGDKNLRRLQETLNQNLATLASAGTFEQAMHSLTAAIHLLTARSAPPPAGATNRLGPRSGAAA